MVFVIVAVEPIGWLVKTQLTPLISEAGTAILMSASKYAGCPSPMLFKPPETSVVEGKLYLGISPADTGRKVSCATRYAVAPRPVKYQEKKLPRELEAAKSFGIQPLYRCSRCLEA